jgi:hypothetical protein
MHINVLRRGGDNTMQNLQLYQRAPGGNGRSEIWIDKFLHGASQESYFGVTQKSDLTSQKLTSGEQIRNVRPK